MIVSRRKPKNKSEQAAVERMYKTLHGEKVIYTRWLAGPATTLTLTAGGVLALTTLANAASVSSASDFASLAGLYTAYRCKAIKVFVMPVVPNAFFDGTATVYRLPNMLAAFPWTSNTVPTTFQQALDVTGVKIVSGYRPFSINTSYKGDPDAHLWTGTGAAIGSNEQFGISIVSGSMAGTASLAAYYVVPQYLVEFRMAG